MHVRHGKKQIEVGGGGFTVRQLNAACPPILFCHRRPFNLREILQEIRSLIFTGTRFACRPRLHANNAIKRFEYSRDNALSPANSQLFLPVPPTPPSLSRSPVSRTICIESHPLTKFWPSSLFVFIEGKELAAWVNSVSRGKKEILHAGIII